MAKLFDYNNPIWKFMGRLADLFFLTVLWAACSLPVITIGASTTALYYVALKMAEGKEGYLAQYFFQAFRENFRQSTLAWLALLVVGAFFGVDLYWYYHMPFRAAAVAFWVFFMLTVIYLFVMAMVFPLAARLDVGVRKLFFLSFMVSMKHFSWTMLMLVCAVCVIAIGLFVFWPALLFSAGAIAYLHAQILVQVLFPKYGWGEG